MGGTVLRTSSFRGITLKTELDYGRLLARAGCEAGSKVTYNGVEIAG